MSYTHLTPMERAKIEFFFAQGWSYTAIACQLGRHRMTISRGTFTF
ncbi:MAG: helix-turn-helix domain-containing protein [Candidatus Hydrogenedentales bacterium]